MAQKKHTTTKRGAQRKPEDYLALADKQIFRNEMDHAVSDLIDASIDTLSLLKVEAPLYATLSYICNVAFAFPRFVPTPTKRDLQALKKLREDVLALAGDIEALTQSARFRSIRKRFAGLIGKATQSPAGTN